MNKLLKQKLQDRLKEFGLPIKDPDITQLKEESEIQSACQQWDREMNAINYLIKIAESK